MRKGQANPHFANDPDTASPWLPSRTCSDSGLRREFSTLLFRRAAPCFFAFDLLTCDGKDWRTEPLTDRKQELRRLLAKVSPPFPLRYVDHVDGSGTALFQRVCELECQPTTHTKEKGLARIEQSLHKLHTCFTGKDHR